MTAIDFECKYQTPDPWGVSKYARRDRALKALLKPYVEGKRILELGCGEGYLTKTLFENARHVIGIDISPTAISRTPSLPNAQFRAGDIRTEPLAGFDIIAAIECIYYLTPRDRELFFQRVKAEHRGILAISAPIEGGDYFTHQQLLSIFERYNFHLVQWRNIVIRRRPGSSIVCSLAVRLPIIRDMLANWTRHFICHRAYILAC